mmetsp:Transcript_119124/g.273203  ORF Transcript_119124/g.273203 Transcript_119124/m.273203 type:complete len:392 (+) Transcript_119124:2-1177(+)
MDYVVFGLAAASNFASFSGCWWLKRRISLLGRSERKRVFPGQMLLLAKIDMTLAVLLMAFVVVDTPWIGIDPGVAYPLCFVVGTVYCWCRFASVLMSTLIALGVMLVWHRRLESVQVLRRAQVFVIPVAGALALVELALQPVSRYSQEGGCEYDKRDFVGLVTLGSCFCFSVVCYVLTLLRAALSPAAARNVVLMTAILYPLGFIVSFLPLIVVGADFVKLERWEIRLSLVIEGLNGLLNTCGYFVQSRYAKAEAIRQHLSGESGSTQSSDGVASFRVVFGPVEAEVVEVSFATAAAARASEMEIGTLDSGPFREPEEPVKRMSPSYKASLRWKKRQTLHDWAASPENDPVSGCACCTTQLSVLVTELVLSAVIVGGVIAVLVIQAQRQGA